jgi:signal transduction histidine kinase
MRPRILTVTGSMWRAMAGRPVAFLRSPWPWRSVLYIVGSAAVAGAAWVVLPLLLAFPPLLLLAGVPIGSIERQRLHALTAAEVRNPHEAGPTGAAWVRARLREPATWRELGYAACLLTVLLVADAIAAFLVFLCGILLAAPLLVAVLGPEQFQIHLGAWMIDSVARAWVVALLGLPATVATLYLVTVLAGGQAAFARWLLTPAGPELGRRLAEVTQSRNRLVSAFEAERRRIERDLHDGAQQHLLLLSMKLGLAEVELAGQSDRARQLVGEAHEQARLALAAIREQIRGIHPQVLTDYGLAEAIRELTVRCPLPVEVAVVLPVRPPVAVESTAYFVVSEALTNVLRHAAATTVGIRGGTDGDRLWLTVTDDGRGGADPARGTGMRGLADRVAVMDGTLHLSSPPGGPTVVRIDLPCRVP